MNKSLLLSVENQLNFFRCPVAVTVRDFILLFLRIVTWSRGMMEGSLSPADRSVPGEIRIWTENAPPGSPPAQNYPSCHCMCLPILHFFGGGSPSPPLHSPLSSPGRHYTMLSLVITVVVIDEIGKAVSGPPTRTGSEKVSPAGFGVVRASCADISMSRSRRMSLKYSCRDSNLMRCKG